MNLKKKIFFMLTFVLVALAIVSCSVKSIVTISFTEDEYVVRAGAALELDVDIDAGSDYDKNAILNELTFTSSDESVAKVTNGVLVGVGEGDTTIKVEWSKKVIVFDTAKVKVLVGTAPKVVFTEYSSNMLKGATQTLGYEFDTDHTDATIEWSSSDKAILTVEDGVVTAVGVGTAKVIATAVVGVSKLASELEITVSESDFAINYVLNGGINNEGNPAGFNVLELPLTLANPSREGYEFKGWFTDAELTTPFTQIAAGTSEDVTVYAKWEAIVYNLTYDLDGGVNSESNPATFTVEDTITLADATKDGMKFVGWVDADGNPVTEVKNHIGDLALKATWTINSYKIEYELNGGRFVLPYIFQNHLDMVQQFATEFNAFTGRDVALTVNDDGTFKTNFFDRSWFGDGSSKGYLFLTDEANTAKWGWMLDLINQNRVARGIAELGPSDGQAEARGEIHNFLGLCDRSGEGANSGFGGDYSLYTFETYCDKLPTVDGVLTAPTTYAPGEETVIPDPVREDYTFVNWGTKVTEINTTANSGFWSTYATDVFLFKPANFTNATFSFRVGLVANPNGTYKVDRLAQSGESFTTKDLDLLLVLSESNSNWASYADVRSAVKVGQTVIVDGDLKTGKANVSFWDIEERTVAASVETTAKSGFWTTYATDVFLFDKNGLTSPTYSFRVGIVKQADGTFVVDSIAPSGASFTTTGLDYELCISESNGNWASYADLRAAVKVGQIVVFDGDPTTGKCTVKFINNFTTLPATTEGDLKLTAAWVQISDENDLLYSLDGGTLSEGAPTIYLTSEGLTLTATAEKVGYTFKGWALTKGGAVITEIPAGTRGEITLFAVYEVIEYVINYELNGGTFQVDKVVSIYDDFAAIVADFLADYEAKYGLSGLTPANFYTKSNSFGLVGFFKDEELASKWAWLQEFMLSYAPNYSGLTYMKNASSATNYNKYWRANLAAFLQQTKLTSPLTMDFTGIDNESFWADVVPTKIIKVSSNPEFKYTVEQLPLTLAAPVREGEEVTFVGWCDNEYLKRPFDVLPVGTVGDIKLYAKWSDSVEGKEMAAIEYVLNDGVLPEDAAKEYETGVEFTLPSPTKPGYVFLGWTRTADGTEYSSTIAATEYEKVTVYAHWDVETYNINYELAGGSFEIVDTTYAVALVGDGVTITTSANSDFWNNYTNNVFLFKGSSATKALYAWKLAINEVNGQYEIASIGASGDGAWSYDGYDWILLISDSHADVASFADFKAACEVGKKLIITGDPASGNTTIELASPVEADASLYADANSGFWSNYTSHVFLFKGGSATKALYAWKLALKDVNGALVVASIGASGDSAWSYDGYDWIILISDSHGDVASFDGFKAACQVGSLVTLDGDPANGIANVNVYSGEKVIETTTVVAIEHPTTYNVEQLPLDLVDPVAPAGKEFYGWYLRSDFLSDPITALPVGTLGDVTLYARFEDPGFVAPVLSYITYELYGGDLVGAADRYAEGTAYELPTPTKEGYDFVGWTLVAGTNDYITEIPATSKGGVVVYANWALHSDNAPATSEITVGADGAYATLAEAIAAASDGDTIVLSAGEYEGATIDKSVTILGPGAGISAVNGARNEEAVFSTDLVVAADDIVIDGIELTGKARITLDKTKDLHNLSILNVYSVGQTVNPSSADSSNGPLYLVAGGSYYIYNVHVEGCGFFTNDDNRPMIAFIDGVDGLTIINCTFSARRNNYNDGIKTDNARVAIRGDVNISHNTFINYQQYVIWLRGFGGGNYTFIGNTFTDCGVTAANHAAFNFITYKGGTEEEVHVEIKHNTITNGYMLLRIDTGATNHDYDVQFNALNNCNGSYYIKNSSTAVVHADNNYWGTATPDEAKFLGVASHEDSYGSSDEVPSEEEAWLISKISVGEGHDFATLTEALAVAEDGDEIFVYAGTYDEEVTVDKKVTIYGPNYDQMGWAEDRVPEAIFTKKFTIAANGVVINGLKFTDAGNIVLAQTSGVVIKSIVQLSDVITSGNDARKGQMVNTGAVSNLLVTDSYFNVGSTAASGRDNIVFSNTVASNLSFVHNHFYNEIPAESASTYSEAIKVQEATGYIQIVDNDIHFTTDNFIIFLGSVDLTTERIDIVNNYLGGYDRPYSTAGVAVRTLKTGSVLNIVHNEFVHHHGNVIDTRYAGAAEVNVMYNSYDDQTSFKWTNVGDAVITYKSNYYAAAQTTTTTDAGEVASLDDLEKAYDEYMAGQTSAADTKLVYDLDGGYALEALPRLHVFGIETVLPTAIHKEGYKFLGWVDDVDSTKYITSISARTNSGEITLYAKYELDAILVGAGQKYETLGAALAAAPEGAVIKLLPGTYDETVTVTTRKLTILGANAGVAGTAQRGEETILGGININADNLVIDGIKFSNVEPIKIGAANITIQNCIIGSTPTADGQSMISATKSVNSVNIINNLFTMTKGWTHYRAIRFEGSGIYTQNVNIIGNKFENLSKSSTYIDCVKLADLKAGFITITDNEFDWAGNNWTIFIGGGSCATGVTINFNHNVFTSEREETMSGATFRNLKDDTVINVIGNSFSKVGGTVLQLNGATAAHATVMDNAFLDTSAKIAFNVTEENFVFDHNYLYTDANFSGSLAPIDAHPVDSADATLADEVMHKVLYIARPGSASQAEVMFGEFLEGVLVDITLAPAKYSGYKFAGWFDNPTFEGEAVTKLGSQTRDITLYAKFEEIPTYKLTYVMNGGKVDGLLSSVLEDTIVVLPTPEKEGSTFLGWGLTEDAIEYVSSITVISDMTLYAIWQDIPVYKVTYDLDGGSASGLVESALKGTVITLPTPYKLGGDFLGWTLVKGGTDYITSITLEADTEVFANWEMFETYEVTFVLNGGSVQYASREELVNDFIADYSSLMGKTYKVGSDIPTGAWADIDFHTFFGMTLADGTTVRSKWLWLAEYLLELSERDLAGNNCNVLGLKALINETAMSGDNPYGLSYAFRAFLAGSVVRPGTSYSSVDHSVYENANGFWAKLSEHEDKVKVVWSTYTLPEAHLENYSFAGWYLTEDFSGDPVTSVTAACTVYAKFAEGNPVKEVKFTNAITELKRFETYQLAWELIWTNEGEGAIKNVYFASSDANIASVDDKGLITAITCGSVTITITSASGTHPTATMTFEVYAPDHFEVSYATESYGKVDEKLQLNAEYIKRDGTKPALVWTSSDETIATVDGNGLVTLVGEGMVKITAALADNGSFTYDFYVTVISDDVSEAMQQVLDAHNSNPFTRYELGIGAGGPAYYRDVIGSVSDIMYNESLSINKQYYVDGKTPGDHYGGLKSSIEWICIHYTGNMSPGSTAAANANYFAGGSGGTSINYVVGNDGVFEVIDDLYVAFHAGDGTGVKFEWYEAGVDYTEGDPQYPSWGIVKVGEKFYYTLNGNTTTVEVPDPAETITTNADKNPSAAKYTFASTYSDPKWFNEQGIPFKVENGKYYIGTTWWCYTQVLDGRICSRGGNLNSVGIESAVNPEADLWYTWDKLAKLVAYLMDTYDLDITRVRMHHFFSAKDCHQPFLEHDLEIWGEFIDKVEAEYALLTTLKDSKFAFAVEQGDTDIVSSLGRIVPGEEAKTVRYTVTITTGETVEEITLATAVNGIYAKVQ